MKNLIILIVSTAIFVSCSTHRNTAEWYFKGGPGIIKKNTANDSISVERISGTSTQTEIPTPVVKEKYTLVFNSPIKKRNRVLQSEPHTKSLIQLVKKTETDTLNKPVDKAGYKKTMSTYTMLLVASQMLNLLAAVFGAFMMVFGFYILLFIAFSSGIVPALIIALLFVVGILFFASVAIVIISNIASAIACVFLFINWNASDAMKNKVGKIALITLLLSLLGTLAVSGIKSLGLALSASLLSVISILGLISSIILPLALVVSMSFIVYLIYKWVKSGKQKTPNTQ